MEQTCLGFTVDQETFYGSFSEVCNAPLTFFFFLKMPEEPKLTLDESCDLDLENEEVLSLQETLEALSLSEYVSTFEKEKIDMESLVLRIV